MLLIESPDFVDAKSYDLFQEIYQPQEHIPIHTCISTQKNWSAKVLIKHKLLIKLVFYIHVNEIRMIPSWSVN